MSQALFAEETEFFLRRPIRKGEDDEVLNSAAGCKSSTRDHGDVVRRHVELRLADFQGTVPSTATKIALSLERYGRVAKPAGRSRIVVAMVGIAQPPLAGSR